MSRPQRIAGFGRGPAPTPPSDIAPEILRLAERLASPDAAGGRAVQFVSAREGEGASGVSRDFARAAAALGHGDVWLVELDVAAGAQFGAFRDGRHGALGAATRGSPDGSSFLQVTPSTTGREGGELLQAHPVAGTGLWVTRFRTDALRPGQKVRITGAADYWEALKAHADLVVVDAPAAESSRAAAAVAPHMDATVIVVAADNDDPAGPALLRDGLAAVGARCAGAVLTRAPRPAPRFLRALTP